MTQLSDVLDTELATFEKHRSELVRDAPGKYVLIHGEEIVGTFESDEEALARGYNAFGNVPFLVREVTEADAPIHMMSVVFGADI